VNCDDATGHRILRRATALRGIPLTGPRISGEIDKAEVKQIADFLNDVYEGICECDDVTTMQMQLTELYRVIRLLMDETFKAQDQDLKVLLASLE
jgi:hypothetical protein